MTELDTIIPYVARLWNQTDDLEAAIITGAQRFGMDPKVLRRAVLDRLMEDDGVQA